MKCLLSSSLLAAFTAAPMVAAPGDHDGPKPGPDGQLPPPNKSKLIAKFDANKDGKLDEKEMAEAKKAWEGKHAEREGRMLEKFDANKDGKLDEKERAAAEEARSKWYEDALKRFDADHDGKLNEQERAEAKKTFLEHQDSKAPDAGAKKPAGQ